MDQCLPRGWRPILREIRPPTEWVKASHPQVQGRPTGHRHHRRRHIEPMGRVKRVGMMTTWECQRRCYWLTAAVYVVLVVLTFYLVVPSQIESGSQIDHLPFFLTQKYLYHLFLWWQYLTLRHKTLCCNFRKFLQNRPKIITLKLF